VDSNTPFNLPFKRGDKITATILLVLAACILAPLGYYFYLYVMPFLIEAAKDTVFFIGELIAIALLVMVFGSKETWTTIYYKWRNISRNIRKAVVREDPVGVLKTARGRMEAKLNSIDEDMTTAAGAVKRQDSAIKQSLGQMKAEQDLANVVQGKDESQYKLHITAAKRWSDTAESMRPTRDMFQNMLVQLQRARSRVADTISDLKNQEQVMALRFEISKDGQKVVRRMKQFFSANPDLDMQEMAVDEIERQTLESEAEIDQFIGLVKPALDGADLKKQADALAAMKQFGAFVDKKALPAPPVPNVIDGELVKEKVGK
jgi:hypothetical protein